MSAEGAGQCAKPISIIFERSWRSGEVPDDRKNVNTTSPFKEEDQGNYKAGQSPLSFFPLLPVTLSFLNRKENTDLHSPTSFLLPLQ